MLVLYLNFNAFGMVISNEVMEFNFILFLFIFNFVTF